MRTPELLKALYHGSDKHRCYYESNCLVCHVWLFFRILFFAWKLRKQGPATGGANGGPGAR